jgi:hypothetical protein
MSIFYGKSNKKENTGIQNKKIGRKLLEQLEGVCVCLMP